MEIEVTIVNWDKHQDIKEDRNYKSKTWRHHWLKLSNTIYRSQSLFGLSSEERWAWACLLCIYSQKGGLSIRLSSEWFRWETGISEKTFESCIHRLESNGTVTVVRHNCQIDKIRVEEIREDQRRKEKEGVELILSSPRHETHSLENFVLNLSQEARDRIQRLYPNSEFVMREVEKMKIWLEANRAKNPKSRPGWTRFVMGWLERGWEHWRKTMPSAKAGSATDWDFIFGEKNGSGNLQKTN